MTAVLAAIARLLRVSPAVAQVITTLVVIALALGSLWGIYAYVKNIGAQEARNQIEKENTDAVLKAIQAARDFDDCVDAGGVWDFRAQKCRRP